MLKNKARTMPILSFPAIHHLGVSVSQLISSSSMQMNGMVVIHDRCAIGASVSMMDLSVEAEAFGAKVRVTDYEVPTIEEGILDDIEKADEIEVPSVGAGRTDIYIDGVRKAKRVIKDMPVFCGVIGPYSLAGRLFDMTELMMSCFDSPEKVHVLLGKCTEFIISYVKAFKEAGADGVVMAEPAAGLLSPALAEEFSTGYVKQIFDAVNSDDFVLCYHNCGNAVVSMADAIASQGADIYHFGNAIELKDIIPLMPKDSVVMGNVDPLLFRDGTPEKMVAAVEKVYNECSCYENFMLSSGCDIPADANWENIDAYFEKVAELYE